MQLKITLLIKIEEQSDKYFDHFSDSMISASQKQNQMQRKTFENNLVINQLLKIIVQLLFTKNILTQRKNRFQKYNSDLRKYFFSVKSVIRNQTKAKSNSN